MNKKLEEVTEMWLSRARKMGLPRAQDAYWTEVFPLVKKKFIQENRERIRPYDSLIITLGTSPQPIILTLETVKPKRVYFLYTSETEPHLSHIIKEVEFLRDHEIGYDRDRIDADNPLELYEKVGEKWLEWTKDSSCSCAVCNTGGKKSMVSAAAVAAYFLRIDLLYVDHSEYIEDLRIPRPGTEYLTVLPNPLVAMGDLRLKEAKSMFNAGNYEMTGRMLSEIEEELKSSYALPVKAIISVFSELVKGYSLWDRFHYIKAAEALKSAKRKIAQFDLPVDSNWLEKNLRALGQLALEQRGKSLFSVLRDKPVFGLRLGVDLLQNAVRKAKLGFLDDAVVRLYRCLELIAQLRLSQVPEVLGGPFNTDNFNWEKIDRDILRKFVDISAQIYKRKRWSLDPNRMPTDIGVMTSHMLLYSMDDPLWKNKTTADMANFHTVINKRNELMLVHGKKRANDEDVRFLMGYAEEFLKKIVGEFGMDWETVLEEHTFIVL